MFLTEQDKDAIASAVKRAEAATSGEIVFAVTDASGRYRHATFQGALIAVILAAAVYLLLPVRHSIGILLWAELISFAVAYAFLPWLPWRRRLIPNVEMESRVEEAAFREFYASGLHRTRAANGVLIYLSLFERRVVVMGDQGIHERMGDAHWGSVRDKVVEGIRRGQAREGICAAVEECGRALATHFPVRPDDVNELPDRVIDRTEARVRSGGSGNPERA